MNDLPHLRKLRWLCRRGMKELDVLLEHFLEQHQSQLAANELAELANLLTEEDDVLWDWLQNPQQCSDSSYRPLLEQIRNG